MSIQSDDHFLRSNSPQNVGSDDLFHPTCARKCRKVRVSSLQFALMNAQMDEGLLLTTSTKSFGDQSKITYGVVLSVLLTKDDLTMQANSRRNSCSITVPRMQWRLQAMLKKVVVLPLLRIIGTGKQKKRTPMSFLSYCSKKGHYRVTVTRERGKKRRIRSQADLKMVIVEVHLVSRTKGW